ncbi:MAG: DNA polymerase III subunit gamma/tau, partial [Alphaproteobacteria bacterium]|nr:DNA polymerase III subunit gamma/tau [Alphaproteobacteria bacterium]
MSDVYISLARKWRPRRLADMVGQEYVVRALQNAAQQERLHHALLFSGTRGIGKTTLARIVAMLINCSGRDSGSAEPCLECDFCRDIMTGRLTDVIEQDAASHTQVDKMRDLLESAVYAPARAKYKVFIIDEVHMLTKQSFNAMLKTLEEPPPHVKFILATTDPQKLPATVRSRCLCFSLLPL